MTLMERRPTKALPYELREHCVIYFEEGLYSQALSLLINLLIAGGSTAERLTPAFAPSWQHLALAATLVVHPSVTTRAASKDRRLVSNEALKLLRTAQQVLDPCNASFQSAFTFSSLGKGRRGTSHRRRTEEGENTDGNDDVDAINIEMAQAGSVWNLGEDFWHVVGWAFNCSVAHPHRWARWSLWLEFMLDVLEADWQARKRQANEATTNEDANAESKSEAILTAALISKYVQVGNRRVVRAVFADGTTKSMNEFKEVFRNEAKKMRQEAGVKRKRPNRINIEEDDFGDYLDEDIDEALMEDDDPVPKGHSGRASPETRAHGDDPDPRVPIEDGTLHFGGLESMQLRLRLLSLLSSVASYIPSHFASVQWLYESYTDHLRPLPLSTFSLFFSPTMLPHFSPAARSSLTQLVLRTLISSSAPQPPQVLDGEPDDDDLTQEVLEVCFLPYTATTASLGDNAKVSLLVEALLRLLAQHVGLEGTRELKAATERGIAARQEKVKAAAASRRRDRERERERDGDLAVPAPDRDPAWLHLSASAARLRCLVDVVCVRDGVQVDEWKEE